ncbi:hypothetical protein GCM10009021_30900 [Halarchaeum nitratireducens]|uniref:Uncharacterized protein n=1 Tax=Halarchaeum nitratireducens TaxID=489913 RepID=A0A830GFP9_9EURY|nr:hypothetical protein GCM10009021_30900 [Halarchaeum nitratireducens]
MPEGAETALSAGIRLLSVVAADAFGVGSGGWGGGAFPGGGLNKKEGVESSLL